MERGRWIDGSWGMAACFEELGGVWKKERPSGG